MEKVFGAQMLQNGKHFCLGSGTGDILTGDNLNKNEITLVIDVACAEAMGNPKSVVELLSGCGGIGLAILNFFWNLDPLCLLWTL